MAVADMVVVGIRDVVKGVSVWGMKDDGTVAWTYDTGGLTRKALISAGSVFIVGTAADNGDGTKNLWKLSLTTGLLEASRYCRSSGFTWDLALDSVDRLIVGTNDGASRLPLDLSSEETFSSGGCLSCAIDLVDNSIYIGSGGLSANIRKYASNLTSGWTATPYSSSSTYGIGVLSNQKIVFVQSGRRYAYDKDGNQLWGIVAAYAGAERVKISSLDRIFLFSSNLVEVNETDGLAISTTASPETYDAFIAADGITIYTCGGYSKAFNIRKEHADNLTVYGQMVTPSCGTLYGISADPSFSFSKELKDDIQGFWKLNDNAANTTVVDDSGNAYDGVASKNTSVMSTVGKINEALTFVEADSDEVNIGNVIPALNLAPSQDLSIAFWFKWAGGGDVFNTIIHKWKSGVNAGFGIYINRDQSKIRASIDWAGTTAVSENVVDIIVDTWYLAVWRVDRTGNSSLSLNNWADFQKLTISSYVLNDVTNVQNFYLGANAALNASYGPYNGVLDCVAVWDRLITEEEEAQIWNDGNGTEDYGIWEAPVISVQPISQTKSVDDSVTFSVTATGTPTPTYQWKKDGNDIFGETSDSLSFTVDANSGGDYTCVASNLEGWDTSDTATLSIIPLITDQSSSTPVPLGQLATFIMTVVGYPVVTYQWSKDGSPMVGETSSSLSFYTESSDAGTYTCVVTNVAGSDISDGIVLTIISNPYTWNPFNLILDAERAD